uniref:Transcription factor bHLH110 n=1 Tax=Anthurium amnicola TaxID=1678845 RepID=A0A1D1ZAU6_9ARAE
MEPSEPDRNQQQQEQLQGSVVAAPAKTTHGGCNLAWNTILLLKGEHSSTTPNVLGAFPGLSFDPKQGHEALVELPSPLITSMVHDLGVQWPCGADTCSHQGQLAKTTEELSDSLLKLTSFGAVWNPGEHPSPTTGCSKYDEQGALHDLDVGLLCHTDRKFQLSARGRHHTLLPIPNASSFWGDAAAPEQLGCYSKMLLATGSTPSSSSFPSLFSMQELQGLELLASARFGETLRQPSLSNVAFFGEGEACGLGNPPLPNPGPSGEFHKISSLLNGVTEGKRANGVVEHKASPPAAKKPRTEPRSSTSPFKVRKEKLGDRVAALQQLVAPFGKTDTASVLTEAVGYIKFLQEQVQTLSMPYLRSSNKSKIRTAQEVSNEENDDIKHDLRSRGLCLVPLSYTSFFSSESGSAWSPSYFRGT